MIVETRQNMPKDNGAIDFGRLKRAAPIHRILALYDVTLRRSGTAAHRLLPDPSRDQSTRLRRLDDQERLALLR